MLKLTHFYKCVSFNINKYTEENIEFQIAFLSNMFVAVTKNSKFYKTAR